MPDAAPRAFPAELRDVTERALEQWRRENGATASAPEQALAVAIRDGRLHVAYQPIVDLADGHMVAVEALVRLDPAPMDELGDAERIIGVAERSGLIVALGADVLARSLFQLARWREEAGSLQVHVNASPIELRDPGYPARLGTLLGRVGLPPEAVVIEVTETVALERESEAAHALVAIAAMGIEIALDDFGTGFASLDLLASTPARTLKLDRSFVAALGEQSELVRGRAMIMQAAIGMGRSLGLELIGEGIESPLQARTLLSWGCQLGQGYLYGRPVRADDVDLRTARNPASSAALTAKRDRTLSPIAVDVGIGLATVLAATDADTGVVRADAVTAATVIASALGSDRVRADTAALLAAVADARGPLERFGLDPDTDGGPIRELLVALEVAPVIGRDTTAGAIARTAWALATSRAAGDAAPDPALLAAHPDPSVDADLRARVGRWWTASRDGDPRDALLTLERRLHARGDADQRLRSLVGLARAIGSSGDLEDVLEVTAEEARRVLGAGSVTITRWAPGGESMQVLVRVGELADGEVPRPDHEIIDLDDVPVLRRRVSNHAIHIESLGDDAGDRIEQDALTRTGRGSNVSIPLVVEGELWGSMGATTTIGSPPFSLTDAPFLSAVASFVGVAIARAQDVATLTRLVHKDQLTGLPNRHALEDEARQLLGTGRGPLTLALFNVQALRDINDEYGHATGDRLLVEVANILSQATSTEPDAFAARLSGDEFCLLVPTSVARGRRLAARVLERVQRLPPPQPRLTVGIAQADPADRMLPELLARANAAQYRARASGAAILVDHGATTMAAEPQPDAFDRRRDRRGRPEEVRPDGSLTVWADVLGDGDVGHRVSAMADVLLTVLDLNRWILGRLVAGTGTVEITAVHLSRSGLRGQARPPEPVQSFDLGEAPRVLEALERGLTCVVRDGDRDVGEHERHLLLRHGLTCAIVVPIVDVDDGRWLLTLAFDEISTPPTPAIPLVDALLRHTFGVPLELTPGPDGPG